MRLRERLGPDTCAITEGESIFYLYRKQSVQSILCNLFHPYILHDMVLYVLACNSVFSFLSHPVPLRVLIFVK